MTTVAIRNDAARAHFLTQFEAMSYPFTASIVKGADRTKEQNRLLHKWFGEIAAHLGDTTPNEIKAQCNLTYGRPILARDDPTWEKAFGYLFDVLSHEKKLVAIRLLDVPFTRNMKVPQLTEYMDQMGRDYRGQGVQLTDPDMRGMEDMKR